jgi:hypothetical protein
LRPLSKESEFIEKRFAERGVKAQKKFLKKSLFLLAGLKKQCIFAPPFEGSSLLKEAQK